MVWGSELRSGLELATVWDSRWMADHPFISVFLGPTEERLDVCVCVYGYVEDICLMTPAQFQTWEAKGRMLLVERWQVAVLWCPLNFWNVPCQICRPASLETPERVWTCGCRERRTVKMEGNLPVRDRMPGRVFELCSQWHTVPVLCF